MKDRLNRQPTTVHKHSGSAVSLHGRLWCYRDIFLAPYKSGRRQAIDDARFVPASVLGGASIGRVRAKLQTLYAARGMAVYGTRMAFEGVLEE
jgi:hypothetical protein